MITIKLGDQVITIFYTIDGGFGEDNFGEDEFGDEPADA